MAGYRTVKQASEEEFIINRSRFIGRCYPVKSEEEATAILNDIRKQHWDATHNCYAYRIGETAATARFSDDGEPGGTAGMPIMDVLRNKELTDVLCIVTRYFGGILLGAGGLVRAYSRGAADAVTAAGVINCLPAKQVTLSLDYSRYAAMEGFIRSNAQVANVEYGEGVTVTVMVTEEALDTFTKNVVEKSDGRCTPTVTGEGWIRVEE